LQVLGNPEKRSTTAKYYPKGYLKQAQQQQQKLFQRIRYLKQAQQQQQKLFQRIS
jgi:hypothetical protein